MHRDCTDKPYQAQGAACMHKLAGTARRAAQVQPLPRLRLPPQPGAAAPTLGPAGWPRWRCGSPPPPERRSARPRLRGAQRDADGRHGASDASCQARCRGLLAQADRSSSFACCPQLGATRMCALEPPGCNDHTECATAAPKGRPTGAVRGATLPTLAHPGVGWGCGAGGGAVQVGASPWRATSSESIMAAVYWSA